MRAVTRRDTFQPGVSMVSDTDDPVSDNGVLSAPRPASRSATRRDPGDA